MIDEKENKVLSGKILMCKDKYFPKEEKKYLISRVCKVKLVDDLEKIRCYGVSTIENSSEMLICSLSSKEYDELLKKGNIQQYDKRLKFSIVM